MEKKRRNRTRTVMFCMFLLCAMCLKAQLVHITGIVTDKSNQKPIPDVSVTVERTGKWVVTGSDGSYSAYAVKGDMLIFSCRDYMMRKVEVKQGNRLDVALNPVYFIENRSGIRLSNWSRKSVSRPVEGLEVVVFAQGKQKKSSLVGNIVRTATPATSVTIHAAESMETPAERENNEGYPFYPANRFLSARESPLSTFSIDVDAASYANIRRYLNNGKMPPRNAVRTEELVNYFTYDYPAPRGKTPVRITMETGACPWNKSHRLVRIGLKAREIPTDNLPPSQFVFLIDVSGSMEGPNRLELVKASIKLLVDNLREKDRVSIVVYADAVGEVLPSTSGKDKQKIREALDALWAGGSTAGGDGIRQAYEIARTNFIREGNNRVILCTDGDFNVGITDKDKLASMIETERKNGVYLTVLGYGMGNYKDDMMQILAEKGNGNHAYIDNLQEANKVLVNEFGGTLHTVAKDVKLQVEFNPAKVQSYRLIGYESRMLSKEDFNDDQKDAGDMGAGHTVTAFYEVIPAGVKENIPESVDALKYRKTEPVKNNSPELLTVKLRYKDPDEYTSKKIEQSLTDSGRNKVSGDFYFASAVAMFGQLLSDSDFKGDSDFDKVVSCAQKGLEQDDEGYRREFIRLVRMAGMLQK